MLTILYLYVARNLGKLLSLECPEPLANLYTQSYFRATWVTTALDAGFWTAMRIRRKWLRDMASIVFSVYYLIAAEQADEKVRKVRSLLTIDHLRVSWNKSTTPYLAFLTTLLRPRFMRYPPRAIRIPRPASSDYKEPVHAWLYFDGPISAIKKHNKIVLDIPGGGFVAMNPRTHDDKLFAWAGKTGLPVLSLDYRKAPEYPYPYSLNECYDAYTTIIATRGRCVGLSGDRIPKIVVTADSAGGNLAVSCTLMIIEAGVVGTRKTQGQISLPLPSGLVLMYPGLDMNIGNWMSDEQMSLIKDRRFRTTNKNIIQRKSMQYTQAAATPHHSDDDDDATPPKLTTLSTAGNTSGALASPIATPAPQYSSMGVAVSLPTSPVTTTASHHPQPLKTRLAMTSMISYFNDRILSPEMMRAMILLYIGPHNRPDFSTDYLLSPILAPDSLLALFPKTCFMTGERDPLVDDTVIFAGRIRKAKAEATQVKHGRLMDRYDGEDPVEITLIPGISHGFMQFVGVFPEGWKYIHRCGRWIEQLFDAAEERELRTETLNTPTSATHPRPLFPFNGRHHRRHLSTGLSSGEEETGLEMSLSTGHSTRDRPSRSHDRPRSSTSQDLAKRKERLLREQLEMRQKEHVSAHIVANGLRRDKSLVRLASEDDLLGRRMLGLVGSLTGAGDGIEE